MYTHDHNAEEYRRDRTRIARLYLSSYVVHGSIHELEKAIERLNSELETAKREADNDVR
jgi:hypothetical protein